MNTVLNKLVATFLVFSFSFSSSADEGMWLPILIKSLNYADMQEKGLKLTAEEIYSINNSSLKDAIVNLGGGSCTAEIISAEGLMLTNHHCAFGSIQQLSTVEKDYLTNGFWAMTKKEELPAPGQTASMLVRMENVTEKVLKEIKEGTSPEERQTIINEAIQKIQEEAAEGNDYDITVRSFFSGNEYYLFVYETFTDIRLVGAPPSSIGKFGGDTDNWFWPRHTGDFALYRIYASKDGKPAPYSPDNVPYKPKHHLPISINGVEEGDYAMVMGYPGSTDRFLTSYGIKYAVEKDQPARVKIRGEKLELMKQDMNASDKVRIQYASKYAQVSNYYKYFQGQSAGLKRLDTYTEKKKEENAFADWVNKEDKRKEKYGEVLPGFESAYVTLTDYELARTYFNEAILGIDALSLAFQTIRLNMMLQQEDMDEGVTLAYANQLQELAVQHFKNYNAATDKKIMAAMLEMYYNDLDPKFHPPYLGDIHKKYNGDFTAYAEALFKKSVFTDEERHKAFLNKPSKKAIDKDECFTLFRNLFGYYMRNIRSKVTEANNQLTTTKRLYIKGLQEMNPKKKYYPDANSTMRLTYGEVLDYAPRDAVHFNHYTTLAGVIEKEDPSSDEFHVPEKLKELYDKKEYGDYGKKGEMRINFITNNDITGGNSGSPVINAKGELIGCAFDLNWEAMTGDIAFETQMQRCICVDARYILFIIDKFAGATNLIDEMTIVKTDERAEKPNPEEQKIMRN